MSQTPAGWYVDAQGVTRWWDGTQWTEHTQPSAPAPQSAPGGVGAQTPEQPGAAQQPDVEPDPDRTRIREVPRAESQSGGDAGSFWQQQERQSPPAQPQNSPWGGAQHQAPVWGGGAPGAVPPPPPSGPPPSGPGGQWGGPAGPGNQYAGWGAQPGASKSGGLKPWMLIVAGVAVLVVIIVVVLVVVLGGNGGSANNASQSPKNASVADFCASMNLNELNPSMTKSDLQKMQDKMRQVGTPSDMPSAARKGWEWLVDVSSASDAQNANQSQLAALGQYYVTTCAGQ